MSLSVESIELLVNVLEAVELTGSVAQVRANLVAIDQARAELAEERDALTA